MKRLIFCTLIALFALTLLPAGAQDSFLPPTDAIDYYNLGQVRSLARLGQGQIRDAERSPDGKTLAVATPIGVWLYDTDNLTADPVLIDEGRLATVLAFSPDGQTIAIGADQLSLWDVSQHHLIHQINTGGGVVSVAFSSDGKTLASSNQFGSDRYGVWLWDVATGAQLRELGSDIVAADLTFSPDSTYVGGIWVCDCIFTPVVWDVATDEFLMSPPLDAPAALNALFDTMQQLLLDSSGLPTADTALDPQMTYLSVEGSAAIAFSPADPHLLAAAVGGEVWIWDLNSGERVRQLQATDESIRDIAISHDGTWIAAGGSEETVDVWNVETGEHQYSLTDHHAPVAIVAFPFDTARDWTPILITIGRDRTIRGWSPETGEPQIWITDYASGQGVAALTFAGQGEGGFQSAALDYSQVIVSTGTGIYVYHPEAADPAGAWQALQTLNSSYIYQIQFVSTNDRHALISAGSNRAVLEWNLATGAISNILATHHGYIYDLDVNSAGIIASGGCAETTLGVWDGSPECTGAELRLYRDLDSVSVTVPQEGGHTATIRDLAFNADDTLLATLSDDGTIVLWGVPTSP